VNLYLKCNDFDCDPLGEDPSTELRWRATAERLHTSSADALADLVPVLSRRLEWVGTQVGRDGVARPFAKLWDRPPTVISEAELALLERMGTRRSSNGARGGGDAARVAVDDVVVGLARREVLDLVGPDEQTARDALSSEVKAGARAAAV
jgi:hypothetical protein